MALAKRAAARLSLSDLIAEGSDFAREAWRDCWLPMLIVATAHALIFVNQHVAASEWRPGPLSWIAPLLFIFYVPLYGGLYRVALGGPAMKTLGPGGLQWAGTEWRLIGVGIVIAFIVGLAMTPFLAAIGIAAVIMGLHAVMSAGPLGQWARWAPAAGVIWLIFFWIMAPRIARLMLGWPYSVARQKTEPFAGWEPAKHTGWALVFALIFAHIPVLLGWLAVYALTLVEPDAIVAGYWPLPEAIGAAVLIGGLTAAIQTPLVVGVMSGAYWLLEGDHAVGAEHGVPLHHDIPSEAAVAAAAAAAASGLATHEAGEHSAAEGEPVEGEAQTGEAVKGVEPHLDGDAPAINHLEGDHTPAPAAEGEVESHDPPEVHEEHTPDPALAGVHPAEPHVADGEAQDEQAAAEHAADPVDSAPSVESAAPEAVHMAPVHPEPEAAYVEPETAPEPLHIEPIPHVEPELHAEPTPVEPAPHVETPPLPDGALSPWPHSVLPPWPNQVSASRPFAPPPTRPVSTLPTSALTAAISLASDPEPGHPSGTVAE